MTVNAGDVALKTVTVKVQLLVFPLASLAVTCTSFVPTGKIEPEMGDADTVAPLSQRSTAEGRLNETVALLLDVQTRRSDGHAIEGGVVSTTSIVRVPSTAWFPLGSAAL